MSIGTCLHLSYIEFYLRDELNTEDSSCLPVLGTSHTPSTTNRGKPMKNNLACSQRTSLSIEEKLFQANRRLRHPNWDSVLVICGRISVSMFFFLVLRCIVHRNAFEPPSFVIWLWSADGQGYLLNEHDQEIVLLVHIKVWRWSYRQPNITKQWERFDSSSIVDLNRRRDRWHSAVLDQMHLNTVHQILPSFDGQTTRSNFSTTEQSKINQRFSSEQVSCWRFVISCRFRDQQHHSCL